MRSYIWLFKLTNMTFFGLALWYLRDGLLHGWPFTVALNTLAVIAQAYFAATFHRDVMDKYEEWKRRWAN